MMLGDGILKRVFTKFSVLIFSFALILNIPQTNAYFSDIEKSEGNSFSATSLDLILSSDTGNFEPSDPILPEEIVSRNISTKNSGVLDFEHIKYYEYVSGDTALCDAFEMRVFEIGNPVAIYDGLLSSYSYNPGVLASSATNDYLYEIRLAPDASSSLREKSCTFNIRADAWQVGLGGSGFTDTEFLVNTITTGVWFPPAPTLLSPIDGEIAVINSEWTNDPKMDWEDVVWDEVVTYIYQSSLSSATNSDGSFTTPAFTSGALASSVIPAPGTPDGTYYWHVKTCDSLGCGDWSETWTLIVDSTVQEASAGDVVINEIMWMGSDGDSSDEWIELRNTTSSSVILDSWTIENAGLGSDSITLSGTIPADGYFLIGNFNSSLSAISDGITVDQVLSELSLVNTGEQLILIDAVANTVDQTPATGVWAKGVNDNGTTPLKQSMERNDTPGVGTNDTDWHTCIDVGCNDTSFWDMEGADYGTPKAANLSENDPTQTVEEENSEIPALEELVVDDENEKTCVLECEDKEIEELVDGENTKCEDDETDCMADDDLLDRDNEENKGEEDPFSDENLPDPELIEKEEEIIT